MTSASKHYRWEWILKADPETLWPLVADTNRFDRDSGRPAVETLELDDHADNGQLSVRLYEYGVPLEYEQEPFEWVYPKYFSVFRRFVSGPVADLRILAELIPHQGGTRLIYQVWITPKTLIGQLAIPIQIGLFSRRAFERAFSKLDQLAHQKRWAETSSRLNALTPAARARLSERSQQLLNTELEPGLIERLIELIVSGDELVISRLRPYELADYWEAERESVLKLFLFAVRAGLLDFRWDVLCPRSRVAKQSSESLSDLNLGVHCDTCNIDYEANFARSVELTFRPNALIRPAQAKEFCIGGPMATPHVLHQQLVDSHSEIHWDIELKPGRYRLRAFDLPGGQYFRSAAGQGEALDLDFSIDHWSDEEPTLGNDAHIRVKNPSDRRHLILLERMAWSDQALTAAEVTTLQTFRDLFSDEALRPGERISVGSLAILFTDLTASTQYYREVGDAVAFGQIMDHFELVKTSVSAHGGSIVKIMGDSVMAVFLDPEAALLSSQTIHRRLSDADKGGALQIKASIHYGRCIAVTIDGRLDYFGSTVNLASRLLGLAASGQVVMSDSVLQDPGITLRRLDVRPVDQRARGFEDYPEHLWRLALGSD